MPVTSASLSLKCDVVETLDNAPGANTPTVTHNKYSTNITLTSAGVVPVTKVVATRLALVAGAKTIDLTTLTGTNGVAVSMTGLKLQVFKFINRGTNPMTISQGAATAYQWGGANFSIRLYAGQELLLYGTELNPDVSASVKHIDVAGTGTEEFEVLLLAG